MPGLVPGIHVRAAKKDVDGRDIGERSDAVLRTATPGHDDVMRLPIYFLIAPSVGVELPPP
jgi:hypothetical protein